MAWFSVNKEVSKCNSYIDFIISSKTRDPDGSLICDFASYHHPLAGLEGHCTTQEVTQKKGPEKCSIIRNMKWA